MTDLAQDPGRRLPWQMTEDIKRQTFPKLLSPSECQALIQRASDLGFEGALMAGTIAIDSLRNNTRSAEVSTPTAELIWSRLAPLMPELPARRWRGLNPAIRFYRYEPGQFFTWHLDAPVVLPELRAYSVLSLLLYLNDDFSGGQTSFLDASVQPVRGSALLFDHGLRHCGEKVTAGTKYLLRTDVLVAR